MLLPSESEMKLKN